MNVAVRIPMTLEQFLDWEDRQELRYEFDGVRAIAMNGGTWAHDAIQMNIAIEIGTRLRGTACRINGSNIKIQVMGSIRYPDAFVTCGPIRPNDKIAPDPVVIFEVLSPSTGRTDHTVKNREYAATGSVRRYVLLEQAEIAATVFERDGDDWVGHLMGVNAVLAMPEIGIEVPLAALYDGLDMTTPQDDEP